MRWALGLAFATALSAQPDLKVVPLQSDPESIARAFRGASPGIPIEDCHALELSECLPGAAIRSSDVSLRWINLDDDPGLEAILVVDGPAELRAKLALVFDKREKWNLVGSFLCTRLWCETEGLIEVQQFTKDSPRLLLLTRELGGSTGGLVMTEIFQLREGKLWPVLQVRDDTQAEYPGPRFRERRYLLASDDRIVIHTVHEQPPGREVSHKCEARRWDAAMHTFVTAADQASYCDPKTGKPIPGKSYQVFFPRP